MYETYLPAQQSTIAHDWTQAMNALLHGYAHIHAMKLQAHGSERAQCETIYRHVHDAINELASLTITEE